MYVKNKKFTISTNATDPKFIRINFKRTDLMLTEDGPSGSMLEAEYVTKKVSDKCVPRLTVTVHNEDAVTMTYANAHETLDLLVEDCRGQDEDDNTTTMRLEKNDYLNNEHKTLTLTYDCAIADMRKGKINLRVLITLPTAGGGLMVDKRRSKDLRNSHIDLDSDTVHPDLQPDIQAIEWNLITRLKSNQHIKTGESS